MQDEVNQLTAELNRIAQTTTFNGQNILDGTMGVQNYQVGANAGEIITATGTNFQTHVYGNHRIEGDAALVKRSDASVDFGAAPTDDYTYAALTVSGSLGSVNTSTTSTTAKALAAEVNNLTSKTGVTATARTEALLTVTGNGAFSVKLASDNSNDNALTISYTINKTEYDQVNNGIKLVNASGNDIKLANDLVSVAGNGSQKLNTYKADGNANGTAFELTAKSVGGKLTTAYAKGVVTFDSEKSFSVSGTTDAAQAFSIMNATAAGTANAVGASELHSVAQLDVTSFDNAQLALEICDAAINIINSERAKYGALQSRFESTIKNLEVNSENTSNARSRIQDADYAAETAELSRTSILQQAGTAMLAQANQLPQSVLSLIG